MSTEDAALSWRFAELARVYDAQRTLDETLKRIVTSTVETVPGCAHAGVMLLTQRNAVSTRAASDEVPGRVDAIQYQLGQGPCLSAINDRESYQIDDLATEPRWPEFGRRAAAETGIHSMLSYRLFVHQGALGSLNLYSPEIAAFDESAFAVGAVLAAHAAVAIRAVRERARADSLERALASSREIGIAMGIIMAREQCSRGQAFDLLKWTSQHRNIKVRELAERIALLGDLGQGGRDGQGSRGCRGSRDGHGSPDGQGGSGRGSEPRRRPAG